MEATKDQLLSTLTTLGFDTGSGIELVGGDSNFYCELVGDLYSDFLAEESPFLDCLTARPQGNPDCIRKVHSLKSCLRTLGNKKGALLAETVERGLSEGMALSNHISALNVSVETLRTQLRPILAS